MSYKWAKYRTITIITVQARGEYTRYFWMTKCEFLSAGTKEHIRTLLKSNDELHVQRQVICIDICSYTVQWVIPQLCNHPIQFGTCHARNDLRPDS